jgi:DNA-binding response OmpR family regulator
MYETCTKRNQFVTKIIQNIPMPYRVLYVGDGIQLPDGAWSALGASFDAGEVRLASAALAQIQAKAPSLILAQEDLPDMDGLAFLAAVRHSGQAQVPLILMDPRGDDERVLRAFELGADDVVAGSCDPRELVARINVVLRRRYEALAHWGGALAMAGVEIDPSQRRCRVEGKRVKLQPREFELLEILMRKAGRTLSRAYLLETVWGMASDADTRAVDVMISRVRRKLGPKGARLIETISKLGYCFNDPSAD